MQATTDPMTRPPEPRSDEADVVDLDGDFPGRAGRGDLPEDAPGTGSLRLRLTVVAAFLTLFHLLFTLVKLTGPTAGAATTSDVPAWSLLLRLAGAALVLLLLRSPLRLSHRLLRMLEAALFGFEVVMLLATQYLSAVDLIDQRDLVDAVAVQKNGVLRAIVLMILHAVFLPRSPATTARVVLSIAASLIVCHGVVLHHADTLHLERDDLANHQIVMANALFLIAGAALATLAAHFSRGGDEAEDGQPRVGPYRLIRRIDDGGDGDVYLAEHRSLRRPAALKVLRDTDPAAVDRFDREVRAAARIVHPNMVAVHDAGRTDEGLPYCAMEYVFGLCVADIVRESGPMPPARAIYVGRQICDALAEVHRHGLVHRDLHPANVLLSCLSGTRDVAKLLDFGAADVATTGGGTVTGTPEYLAPEQGVAGATIDARADVYGLGTLLYFMTTGQPPFERSTPAEVLRAHLADPVPAPAADGAPLPADLAAVILRCLAKRPPDRYPDVAAVAAALGACDAADGWNETRADSWWAARRTP